MKSHIIFMRRSYMKANLIALVYEASVKIQFIFGQTIFLCGAKIFGSAQKSLCQTFQQQNLVLTVLLISASCANDSGISLHFPYSIYLSARSARNFIDSSDRFHLSTKMDECLMNNLIMT